jgi:hypothetical protein
VVERSPDEAFAASLANIFAKTGSRVVTFRNPLQNDEASNTIYAAWTGHRAP